MKKETNSKTFFTKLHHFWIWFWYSDITRIFIVLIPSYFVFVIPLLLWFEIPTSYFASILSFTYLFVFLIAMLDNNYSNLRKIGLDEYRKKLR
jgi:hypothetical protein